TVWLEVVDPLTGMAIPNCKVQACRTPGCMPLLASASTDAAGGAELMFAQSSQAIIRQTFLQVDCDSGYDAWVREDPSPLQNRTFSFVLIPRDGLSKDASEEWGRSLDPELAYFLVALSDCQGEAARGA